MHKIIYTSGISTKFYIKHDWNKHDLNNCALKGEVITSENNNELYYYFPIGSIYDSKKLLELGYVYRGHFSYTVPERLDMTDKEILDSLNWE